MDFDIQKLWPAMCGSEGVWIAIGLWRAFLASTVPLFNAKLKAKFTELLVESPSVANDIVHKKWYQTLGLILRLTIDIQLPNENSLIVHEAKEQVKRETATIEKPKQNSGHVIWEWLVLIGFIALLTYVLCGCSTVNKSAYKAEQASTSTVTSAMAAWNDYVGLYHPTIQEELIVRQALERYRTCALMVADAGIAYSESKTAIDEERLETAISAAALAMTDLFNTLKVFGALK